MAVALPVCRCADVCLVGEGGSKVVSDSELCPERSVHTSV